MNILIKINSIKTQNELNEFRNMVNEALDNRAEFINLCEIAYNASQKSFGYIKEAFENISPELFKIAGGKKILTKYVKTIKESKNLSSLHTLYENVRKINGNSDINFFVNNITDTEWGVDTKTLKEDTEKLGRILAEGILKAGSNVISMLPEHENYKLNSAIEFIAENKKTNKNLSKYSDAIHVIREQAENNPKTNVFEKVNLDEYAANLLEAFNKKYTSDLTDDDWKLLKEVDFSKDKKEIFNKFKTECVSKLTEVENKFKVEGNIDDSAKVSAILEKVNKKVFTVENITADICGFAEIVKIFE